MSLALCGVRCSDRGDECIAAALVDDEADLGEGSATHAVGDPPLRDVEGVGDFQCWRALVEEREDKVLVVSQPRLITVGSSHGTRGGHGPDGDRVGGKDGGLFLLRLAGCGPKACYGDWARDWETVQEGTGFRVREPEGREV